ncbi:MAG: hypothetical protein JXQ83_08685 [Candidatus Glassbacteria bacterium]|nr:hypothetical protein [Candidatus Glassbacteria bacterium]
MSNRIAIALLSLLFALGSPAESWAAGDFNPYRVLLVIADQWKDPAGFLVDVPLEAPPHYDHSVRPEGLDFMQLVVMLKSWGVPFDILRLDQEMLDLNHFLGPDDRPLYGCILWAADPHAESAFSQDYSILARAVEDYGISLVALSNRIDQPVLGFLLGVRYQGYYMTHRGIDVAADHFLTRGLGPQVSTETDVPYQFQAVVEPAEGVQVLASQAGSPALTERVIGPRTRAVWIGGDAKIMFELQNVRTILRRAITQAAGYCLHKTWEDRYIIVMDDPGGAQNAWLEHWSYPTLTREQIRKHLIEPLKKHDAVLVINVVPGFVNEEKRRVELSFQQDFVDGFGNRQDYISTRQGLEEGLREGVFELQSHGWTHMQPDLDSPPGPWWGASLHGEKAHVGWYREFGDTRRGFKDIPAGQQLFHIRTGKKWLENLFGVVPLSFVSGGGGVSLSYPNHTWILAAREGFGWFCWFGGYLGRDLAVRGWLFEGTPEAPATIPALPDAHDKGIAEHPGEFLKTFDRGPGAVYMGLDEYIGYLHADLESRPGSLPEVWVEYDPHYCRFFSGRKSSWKLDLADWARESLAGRRVLVDGKPAGKVAQRGVQEIAVPAGTGRHRIAVE